MTDLRKKSILVVEDEDDVRESLAAILESEGYSVLEAAHGGEALERLRAADDDVGLILLDMFMPTMNGWAFRDAQVRDPALAAIPVIVITADATAARSARSLGVVEAMTKPLDFDRLLALIGRHC
jgi:CheY-like chemotaxis protein